MRLRIVDCGLWIGGLLLATSLGVASVRAETIDRLLAVAAGQLIMQTDVTAAIDLGLHRLTARPIRCGGADQADRSECGARRGRSLCAPEPTAEAVDRELQRVRQRFRRRTPSIRPRPLGIDDTHLRETLRQDLRMRAYLDQRFSLSSDRRLTPSTTGWRPAPARWRDRSVPSRDATCCFSAYPTEKTAHPAAGRTLP
jgi:hypothetical protein